MQWPVLAALWLLGLPMCQAQTEGIHLPLEGRVGDAQRGQAIVGDRQMGMCLLCHSGPFPLKQLQGNLAPPLDGAGARLSVPQLRLRMVDSRRINPDSTMPAYHRVEGLARVGGAWQGKPLLTAQQVEDVVAYLATLKP